MHARHVLQIGLAALCLGTAREVEASELIVEWTAPPECPEQADVLSIVERSLGDATNVNLTATASVTRAAGLYRARVHITSPVGLGERMLENTRCELLAESVALVIALSAPSFAGARRKPARGASDGGLAPALSAHASAVVGPLPDSHSEPAEPWASRASPRYDSTSAAPTRTSIFQLRRQ